MADLKTNPQKGLILPCFRDIDTLSYFGRKWLKAAPKKKPSPLLFFQDSPDSVNLNVSALVLKNMGLDFEPGLIVSGCFQSAETILNTITTAGQTGFKHLFVKDPDPGLIVNKSKSSPFFPLPFVSTLDIIKMADPGMKIFVYNLFSHRADIKLLMRQAAACKGALNILVSNIDQARDSVLLSGLAQTEQARIIKSLILLKKITSPVTLSETLQAVKGAVLNLESLSIKEIISIAP